jgi:serine/threonine-protein kinase
MTVNNDPFLGTMLGSYKIVESIGAGGMARIYKGFHAELNRYTAIKVVNWGLQEDPDATDRFRREAQAIATLRHPNIVQIFDFGKYANGYFMVMEFIDGRDLSVLLRRTKQQQIILPQEKIIAIIKDVAAALDHAHSHGVIHRDVKPSNIMMSQSGQAILTDFGLVMLSASTSQATLGSTFGTPHYIAPEQAISSAAAVIASDIYSLGVILYEMVTNQLLFDDESPLSVALKHISDLPTPPTAINPQLSPLVEEVVLTALAKEPADRFTSAIEMAGALEAAWSGLAIPVSPSHANIGLVLPAGVPSPAEVKSLTLPHAGAVTPVPPLDKAPSLPTDQAAGKAAIPNWWPGPIVILLLLGASFFFFNKSNSAAIPSPLPPSAMAVADDDFVLPVVSPTLNLSPTVPATATSAPPSPAPTGTTTATPTAAPSDTPTPVATASPTLTPTATATDTPLPPSPTATETPASAGALSLDQLRGQILFKTDRSGSVELYQMNANGSDQQPLSQENWSLYTKLEAELPFSPNGKERIVTRGEGQLDLWRASLVDGQELRITSTQGAEYDAAWSPVDDRIVYVSEETGNGDIYLLNLGGSAVVRLTDNVDDFDKHPTWSPDGSKVAFWSDMGFNDTRQIWQIDLGSGVLTSLSDNPFNDWDPVWVR